MATKNTTLSIHSRIAHEIKAAKKTLFNRHREGLPLRAALDQFAVDICHRFEKVAPPVQPTTQTLASESGATGSEVFDEIQEQAMRAIMTLLNARGIPCCIKRAFADSLEEVAKIAGINQRTIWTTTPGPSLTVNSKVLWEVFETPSVSEMWDLPRKPDEPKRRPQEETDEEVAKAEAKLVAYFLEGGLPDFLMNAILPVIDRAFDHFGLPKPECDPSIGSGLGDYDEENLYPLFLKTKLTSLEEIWPNEDDTFEETPSNLARSIAHILSSSLSPARLKREVGDFVNDISSRIDDSPERVEKVLAYGQCGYLLCPGSDDPLNPCPGPDSSGKHVGEKEEADDPEQDHVDVTLPNGEQVELYGDAADMANEPPSEAQKVLRALAELLHNPETPSDVFEALAGFVADQSNSAGQDVFHCDDVLKRVLNSVPGDERMRARSQREEVSNAAN